SGTQRPVAPLRVKSRVATASRQAELGGVAFRDYLRLLVRGGRFGVLLLQVLVELLGSRAVDEVRFRLEHFLEYVAGFDAFASLVVDGGVKVGFVGRAAIAAELPGRVHHFVSGVELFIFEQAPSEDGIG